MEENEEINDFHEFLMVPKVSLEENKIGVTFKGESNEYLQAHGLIWKLFNEKGANLMINDREIRIFDMGVSKRRDSPYI